MEVVDLQETHLVELGEMEVTVVQGLVQMQATEVTKTASMDSMQEAPVRDPKSVCGQYPVYYKNRMTRGQNLIFKNFHIS